MCELTRSDIKSLVFIVRGSHIFWDRRIRQFIVRRQDCWLNRTLHSLLLATLHSLLHKRDTARLCNTLRVEVNFRRHPCGPTSGSFASCEPANPEFVSKAVSKHLVRVGSPVLLFAFYHVTCKFLFYGYEMEKLPSRANRSRPNHIGVCLYEYVR